MPFPSSKSRVNMTLFTYSPGCWPVPLQQMSTVTPERKACLQLTNKGQDPAPRQIMSMAGCLCWMGPLLPGTQVLPSSQLCSCTSLTGFEEGLSECLRPSSFLAHTPSICGPEKGIPTDVPVYLLKMQQPHLGLWFTTWHALDTFLVFLSPTQPIKSRHLKLVLREGAVPLKTPTYDIPQLSGSPAWRAHWEARCPSCGCGSEPGSAKSCQLMPPAPGSPVTHSWLPKSPPGVCAHVILLPGIPFPQTLFSGSCTWIIFELIQQRNEQMTTASWNHSHKILEPENWNAELSIIIKSNPYSLNLTEQTQRGHMPSLK